MFDSDLGNLSPAATAAAAADAVRAEITAGCRMLEIAAHWADLYPGAGLSLETRIDLHGVERVAMYGGDGTPDVAEFAATRLGLECRKSPAEARYLIADALDLRHRLPLTWRLVRAAQVAPRSARRLAYRTRHLSQQMAQAVDRAVSASICNLPFGRLEKLIDAEIKRVDHERMEREAAKAAAEASVKLGQIDEHGMTELYAHMPALHALQTDQAINKLAHLLAGLKTLPDGVARPAVDTHEAWREVALHLSTSNPVLAAQLWLQDQQPDLFNDDVAPDNVDSTGGCSNDQADQSPASPSSADGNENRNHDQASPNSDPSDISTAGDHSEAADTPSRSAVFDRDTDDTDKDAHHRRQALIRRVIKGIDPTKLVPSNTLYIHCNGDALIRQHGDGDHDPRNGAVARVEDIGPTLLGVVRRWLASGTKIKLQPIIDTNTIRPVDAYEVPDRMREALLARTPASCFPWSANTSRRSQADHTAPFRRPPPRSTTGPPGQPRRPGPPGQTGLHNLGPLPPPEHRYKTHGDITVHQPEPGTYLWKTTFGRILITNAHGTHDLGTGHLARMVWSVGSDSAARAAPVRTWG